MKPKMVILNPKEYQQKFDEAMAYSLSDQHEIALILLLELKEKRWRKYELFKMIVEEYIQLDQYNIAQQILKEICPLDNEQRGELLKLEQLIKYQMEQNLPCKQLYFNCDNDIFKETQQIKNQQQVLQRIESRNLDFNSSDLDVLLSVQYLQSAKKVFELIFGQDFTKFNQLNYEAKLCLMNFTNEIECYMLTLSFIQMLEEKSETLLIKAICLQQMKQYKLALKTLQQNPQFNIKNADIIFRAQYLHFLLNIEYSQNDYIINKNVKPIRINDYYAKHLNKLSQMYPKNQQIEITEKFKLKIVEKQICAMIQYSELFLMEYQISPNSPILQRICDFLIKYAPRYSAGYVHQYQLFIDQKLMEKVLALEQPLEECEDCSLKYITLAKLYKEKKQYAQAHKALEQAKRLNEFNEEIYQIEIDLLRIQKMYQQAYKTLRHLVQLERENYRFICSTIAPLIDKYEYYRVIDLLQLVDDESRKFDELKLLLRIVSYQSKYEDQQIMQSIESLDQKQVIEFLGHYWLSKNQVKDSCQFYEQIEFKPMFVTDQKHYDQQKKIIASIKLIDKLKQHEITDIICQIGIQTYIPSQDKSIIIHQRYINTIGFVLTSIVFNNNQDQNVQIINSKYDMEVPKIDGFKLRLIQIIEKNFCQNYITSEKYQTYVKRGLLQLQKLFTSTDIFMDCLYDFSDQYKQQMIELFNYIDHEVVQVDEDLQTIYSIPFFADPISRYALVSVIKIIGYFTEFELVNNYQRIEEWLTVYMIKYNIEAYYQQIMKNKQNIKNN